MDLITSAFGWDKGTYGAGTQRTRKQPQQSTPATICGTAGWVWHPQTILPIVTGICEQ